MLSYGLQYYRATNQVVFTLKMHSSFMQCIRLMDSDPAIHLDYFTYKILQWVLSLFFFKENTQALLDRRCVYSFYFGYAIFQKTPEKETWDKNTYNKKKNYQANMLHYKWLYFQRVRVGVAGEKIHRTRPFGTQKALLYWLHWAGLNTTRWGRDFKGWDKVWGGRGGRMQPSLRQHKQHADTVTGNIICRQHHHIAL